MKRLIASSLLVASAFAQTWYDYDYAADNLGAVIDLGPFWMNYGYDFYLEYYTTYRAGEGPYYDTDAAGTTLYPDLTTEHHYEEYGFNVEHWADAYL